MQNILFFYFVPISSWKDNPFQKLDFMFFVVVCLSDTISKTGKIEEKLKISGVRYGRHGQKPNETLPREVSDVNLPLISTYMVLICIDITSSMFPIFLLIFEDIEIQ